MPIKLLNPLLASQIAAGEVIERPASVVKELLENSIDALASHISIDIEKGGVDLIRVRDDGVGIPKEELSLSILRYATSKIIEFEDLEKLVTLGFRGEALASISSVSRFTLISRTKDQNVGYKIFVEGQNETFEEKPTSHPIGTSVEVRDLFFNVSARRKFLRSDQTEFRQIEDVINKIALSNFAIGLSLKRNNRVVYDFDAANTLQQKLGRISHICGIAFVEQALEIDNERDGLKVKGWISKPSFSRNQADLQYLYINGRIVKDKTLSHALRSAYRDVLPKDRYPSFILFLELSPELVDVNVHPTKHEVRFRDSRMVHDFIYHAAQRVLSNAKGQFACLSNQPQENHEFCVCDANTNLLKPKEDEYKISSQFTPHVYLEQENSKMDSHFATENGKDESFKKEIENKIYYKAYEKQLGVETNKPMGYALAQLYGTYILAQNETGLILVDMHAACERIAYEKLKSDYDANKIASQTLLIPFTITCNSKEEGCIKEYGEDLRNLGLDIEFLNHDTLVVRKIPFLLCDIDIEQFVRDVLADLVEYGASDASKIQTDKILANFACHHSVRSNQKMTIEEMNSLLRQLEQTERGGQCSHGRPTWVHISLDKIKKMFMR